METMKVSKKLLNRLPGYLNYLKLLPPEAEYVSAPSIARALGLGEVQVRKDLAKVSSTGRRRTGRCREELIRDIENYLDLAADTGTVIVGTGKLGAALLDYDGFDEAGLNVMAGFDLQPTRELTEGGEAHLPRIPAGVILRTESGSYRCHRRSGGQRPGCLRQPDRLRRGGHLEFCSGAASGARVCDRQK